MDALAEDDDLATVKASSSLLADLTSSLQRLLYKQAPQDDGARFEHTRARPRDIEHIVKSIDSFQSEPQLLDSLLKNIVPSIAEVCLSSLSRPASNKSSGEDILNGLATILYTLGKVRGRKVISRLLNNEPQYLEPILARIEQGALYEDTWQVKFVLLLWLSHLLLTPFDLLSISNDARTIDLPLHLHITEETPALARRIFSVCVLHLQSSSACREAAAAVLVRLVVRPDVQKYKLADRITVYAIAAITEDYNTVHSGLLRFLAGIATSADMAHLFQRIWDLSSLLIDDDLESESTRDSTDKKLVIKIVRNLNMTTLRSVQTSTTLATFLESSGVLEGSIDLLIRLLSEQETLVRQSAAKAMSTIISALDKDMSQEVIQAVLGALEEQMPARIGDPHLPTAHAPTWHGLTLCLSYTLFNRSTTLEQVPQIVPALSAALDFEQRAAGGNTLGVNTRDAANFGLWSLARRYSTAELSKLDVDILPNKSGEELTLIQQLAVRLVQAACLDPAGNVRRGSSAALQELVGRHPDQVVSGISLIQVVDYQAVGLRRRAMVDVAEAAAVLDSSYRHGLRSALIGWRGLDAVDTAARNAAAIALTKHIVEEQSSGSTKLLSELIQKLKSCGINDVEQTHGLVATMASWSELDQGLQAQSLNQRSDQLEVCWRAAVPLSTSKSFFAPRALRAELPYAFTRLTTAFCYTLQSKSMTVDLQSSTKEALENYLQRLLVRYERALIAMIPRFVKAVHHLELPCLRTDYLVSNAQKEATKPTMHGAGRAFAIAGLLALSPASSDGRELRRGLLASAQSPHVDWRVMGLKALAVTLQTDSSMQATDESILLAIHQGMTDHTIDERGDIGSLVRLEAIACAQLVFDRHVDQDGVDLNMLEADILQLSLDKLDRVRRQAAKCRNQIPTKIALVLEDAEVDSKQYLTSALAPLWDIASLLWVRKALLTGLIACAGAGSEQLLQTCRTIMVDRLTSLDREGILSIANLLLTVMQEGLAATADLHPALEVVAFMMQMQLLSGLHESSFKWRSLLSLVQKAHYKSKDMQRLLAAVSVYLEMSNIMSIRDEVVKKLFSMLKTNPMARVRLAVAEALFMITSDEDLLQADWSRPASQLAAIHDLLQKRHVH